MAGNNGFVIYLRAINLNPGDEPDDMVSLRVWLGWLDMYGRSLE